MGYVDITVEISDLDLGHIDRVVGELFTYEFGVGRRVDEDGVCAELAAGVGIGFSEGFVDRGFSFDDWDVVHQVYYN